VQGFIFSIAIFQRRTGSRGPSSSTPGCVHVRPPVCGDDDTFDPPFRPTTTITTTTIAAATAAAAARTLRTQRGTWRRTCNRTWRSTWPSGGAAPSSPRHHRRRRRLCAARAEMGAQLGSSVAFGSGCGQALPGVPRKAPLCSYQRGAWGTRRGRGAGEQVRGVGRAVTALPRMVRTTLTWFRRGQLRRRLTLNYI